MTKSSGTFDNNGQCIPQTSNASCAKTIVLKQLQGGAFALVKMYSAPRVNVNCALKIVHL